MNLIRNHLVCPYSDCIAHERGNMLKIKVSIDEERNVLLRKSKSTVRTKRTRLPYLYEKWVRLKECPYCNKPVEVVIDETHTGRNIYLRIQRAMRADNP